MIMSGSMICANLYDIYPLFTSEISVKLKKGNSKCSKTWGI